MTRIELAGCAIGAFAVLYAAFLLATRLYWRWAEWYTSQCAKREQLLDYPAARDPMTGPTTDELDVLFAEIEHVLAGAAGPQVQLAPGQGDLFLCRACQVPLTTCRHSDGSQGRPR